MPWVTTQTSLTWSRSRGFRESSLQPMGTGSPLCDWKRLTFYFLICGCLPPTGGKAGCRVVSEQKWKFPLPTVVAASHPPLTLRLDGEAVAGKQGASTGLVLSVLPVP